MKSALSLRSKSETRDQVIATHIARCEDRMVAQRIAACALVLLGSSIGCQKGDDGAPSTGHSQNVAADASTGDPPDETSDAPPDAASNTPPDETARLPSAASSKTAAETPAAFEDASGALQPYQRAGLMGGSDGTAGAAWLDFDVDGDLDLLLTNGKGGKNALFENDGDGGFRDVAETAGVANGQGNSGALAGDLDNDGYPDLLLAGDGYMLVLDPSPTLLYHNNGDGTFRDVTTTAQLECDVGTTSLALGDLNADGFLDVFCAASGHSSLVIPPSLTTLNKLYLNNGDMTFTHISEGTDLEQSHGVTASSFFDYDEDGDQDLLLANAGDVDDKDEALPSQFQLFRNNGDLTFTDVGEEAGLGLGYWMAVALGDMDNDGDFDLFTTNVGLIIEQPHGLFENNGDGTFTRLDVDGLTDMEFGWGASFADFDNDGHVDLIETGSWPPSRVLGPSLANPTRLYMGDGAKGFSEARLPIDLTFSYSSGLAQADYDGDGFPDVVIVTETLSDTERGTPKLLHNEGNDNRWLAVQLEGTESNRGGVGAVIAMTSDDGTRQIRLVTAGSSYSSSETPWPIFGLGMRTAESIEVTWPSGLRETFEPGEPRRKLLLVEGAGEAVEP